MRPLIITSYLPEDFVPILRETYPDMTPSQASDYYQNYIASEKYHSRHIESYFLAMGALQICDLGDVDVRMARLQNTMSGALRTSFLSLFAQCCGTANGADEPPTEAEKTSAIEYLTKFAPKYNVMHKYEAYYLAPERHRYVFFSRMPDHAVPPAPTYTEYVITLTFTFFTLLTSFNTWVFITYVKKLYKYYFTDEDKDTPVQPQSRRCAKVNSYGEKLSLMNYKGSATKALETIRKEEQDETVLPRRKRKVLPEAPMAAEDTLLFSDSFNKEPVPAILKRVRVSQLPEVMKSIIKWDARKDLHTPTQALEFKELERLLANSLANSADPTYLDTCRRALMFLNKFVPTPVLKSNTDYVPPLPYIPPFHPTISLDPPPSERFQTSGKAKRPDYVLNEGPNSLFEFVSTNPNKNWLMPFYKIKSIIKTSRDDGRTFKEITDIIQKLTPKWKKTPQYPDIKDFAWFIPYIPYEVYYYGVGNKQKFADYLKNGMDAVRDRIINQARTYYDVGMLTRKERIERTNIRKDAFVNIMRSPKIQLLFSTGHTKQFVVDYIYANYKSELDGNMMNLPLVSARIKQTKIMTQRERTRMRDIKYSDVEPNSRFLYFVPVSCALAVCTYAGSPSGRLKIWFCFKRVLEFLKVFAMWLCLQLAKVYASFRMFCFSYNVLDTTELEISTWSQIIMNPFETLKLPSNQVRVLQLKSVLHTCYYLCRRDYVSASAWGSNFLITHPDLLEGWSNLVNRFKQQEEVYANVVHNGLTYRLIQTDAATYASLPFSLRKDFLVGREFTAPSRHTGITFEGQNYCLNTEQFTQYLGLLSANEDLHPFFWFFSVCSN